MKKKVILLFSNILIIGCNIQNKPNVMPSVKPSVSSKPTPQITPSSSPSIIGLEKYSEDTYCRPMEMEKAELNNPVRIAVSRDGQYVYTINGSCRRPPFYPEFNKFYYSYCINNEIDDIDQNLKKNIVINQISKDKKIQTLSIDGKPVMGCKLNGEISINQNNELFLTDVENKLYKFGNNKLSEIVNLEPESQCEHFNYNSDNENCIKVKWIPKISLDNNDLYVIFTGILSDFYTNIKEKINKDGGISNFLSEPDERISIFTVYKNKLYTITDINRLRAYNILDKSINNSENIINTLSTKINDLRELDELYENESFIPVSKYITSLKINSKGEIFFNDLKRNIIWKVDKDNILTKFTGDGKAGFKDGKGIEAEFNIPSEMTFDAQDNLYIADTANNAIRKITPNGTVTTFYSQVNRGNN